MKPLGFTHHTANVLELFTRNQLCFRVQKQQGAGKGVVFTPAAPHLARVLVREVLISRLLDKASDACLRVG